MVNISGQNVNLVRGRVDDKSLDVQIKARCINYLSEYMHKYHNHAVLHKVYISTCRLAKTNLGYLNKAKISSNGAKGRQARRSYMR